MAARSRSKSGRTKRSPKRPARGGVPVPPSPADQHEALAARLLEDRTKAFIEALGSEGDSRSQASGPRMEALQEVVHESFDLFDSMLGQVDLDPPIACTSGCIHCCYNQIALTEPEAIVLGLHLLETRDTQQLLDLQAKTSGLVESLKGKRWQEIGMARHSLPCLFLENGNCSVYPARPFACRRWNSVDADMCQQSNLTENAMTLIENHPIAWLIADSIQQGILRGASTLGLEAGYLLMARAIMLLLENGAEQSLLDCSSDWLGGRPFFGRKREW